MTLHGAAKAAETVSLPDGSKQPMLKLLPLATKWRPEQPLGRRDLVLRCSISISVHISVFKSIAVSISVSVSLCIVVSVSIYFSISLSVFISMSILISASAVYVYV